MSSLDVTAVTVPVLLDKLRKHEWQIPQFQRDFVWTVPAVIELVSSILASRPIGMATLWEQSATKEVPLEPIWIADAGGPRSIGPKDQRPHQTYAILDGRQRCTAIAMAFGGLRAEDGKYKFSGRFYLNVATEDLVERVQYLKETDVKRLGYINDAACIGNGLFPLSSSVAGEELLGQWMRYLQQLRNPANYPKEPPSTEELNRRDTILKDAFQGLVATKLAVYIVPSTYHLADVCEIFETLNLTGTKVSTVDLIHSWLYSETSSDPQGLLRLREWISDFGQKDGATGWSSVEDRPELITQIVTACYVSADQKTPPRKVYGIGAGQISSLKAADLLATPAQHWRLVMSNDDLLASFIGDFQRVVADGAFPYTSSPYPISAAIYVGLRWHLHFDKPKWAQDDLNSLYRAFFWRNCLANRYDQGFLTKIEKDIKSLKQILSTRQEYRLANEWAKEADKGLAALMEASIVPSRSALEDLLTDGRQTGATQKALTLPMLARAQRDFIEPQVKIGYPSADVELHHIYAKAWCSSNKSGSLGYLLDKSKAGRDWVNSTANLIPMSRKSNNRWKAKLPGQILEEMHASFTMVREGAEQAFIDEAAFGMLLNGATEMLSFWKHRAGLLASDLIARTQITL
jgi:hypothetical protein